MLMKDLKRSTHFGKGQVWLYDFLFLSRTRKGIIRTLEECPQSIFLPHSLQLLLSGIRWTYFEVMFSNMDLLQSAKNSWGRSKFPQSASKRMGRTLGPLLMWCLWSNQCNRGTFKALVSVTLRPWAWYVSRIWKAWIRVSHVFSNTRVVMELSRIGGDVQGALSAFAES